MKKSRIFLSGFLLATVFISCPLASTAQETISVPFTAVEEQEEAKKSSSCFDNKWNMGAEFIYSSIKMDAINDYVSWINTTWTGTIDDLDYAKGFSVYLQYFFTGNIGIELGHERLEADVSGTYLGGSFGVDTEVDGGLVSLVLKRSLGNGNFSFGARFGVGYYAADYAEYDSGALFQEDDDSAIGLKASVSSNYCLTQNLSIYLSGGYRHLEFDGFGKMFVSPGNPLVELDFSGPFATAGLTFGW